MKHDEPEALVWVSRVGARGSERVSTSECPVSLTTGESWARLEAFQTRKLLGACDDAASLPAKEADAFVLLERELRSLERENDG